MERIRGLQPGKAANSSASSISFKELVTWESKMERGKENKRSPSYLESTALTRALFFLRLLTCLDIVCCYDTTTCTFWTVVLDGNILAQRCAILFKPLPEYLTLFFKTRHGVEQKREAKKTSNEKSLQEKKLRWWLIKTLSTSLLYFLSPLSVHCSKWILNTMTILANSY